MTGKMRDLPASSIEINRALSGSFLIQAGSALVGSRLYLIGGKTHTNIRRKAVYALDVVTWKWERLLALPLQLLFEDRLAVLVNDQIYVFIQPPASLLHPQQSDASSQFRTFRLDVLLGKLHPCYSSGEAVLPFEKSAGEYVESIGMIVTFGGKAGIRMMNEHTSNKVVGYSVSSNAWSEIPTKGRTPSPRVRHCSCLHGPEDIFFYGGDTGTAQRQAVASGLFQLNCKPKRFTWTEISWFAPNAQYYSDSSISCVGHRLFILGGFALAEESTKEFLFVYDLECNAAVQLAGGVTQNAVPTLDLRLKQSTIPAELGCAGHSVAVLKDRLVIVGGISGTALLVSEIEANSTN